MKIVINQCYGGFSLSPAAVRAYLNVKGIPFGEQPDPLDYSEPFFYQKGTEEIISPHNFLRDDPVLVQIVEQLGGAANGSHANLRIVDIPDDVDWKIVDYDGMEHIAELHRTWP